MLRITIVLSIILTLLFSCKKDEVIALRGNASSNAYSTFSFNCDTLGPMPDLGWGDTTTNMAKNIRFWAINPLDFNEIVYTSYKSELLTYNIVTKKHKLIDYNVMGFANVSKNGWIVYNKLNLNVYVIKFNGDSLKQITNNGNTTFPQWDFTGKFVYCRDNSNSVLYKIDLNGNYIDTINSSVYVFSKMSDNFLKTNGNSLYYKNILTNSETFLFTDNMGMRSPTLSNDDKFIFWINDVSLQRYNIQLQKRDTLVKFCENFTLLGLHISPKTDKLTLSYAFRKQVVKPWKLLHLDSAIEFDIKTEQWRKLNFQFNH